MTFKKVNLQIIGDARGSLIAIEGGKNLPFSIKRVYYIFGTGKNVRRGFHAHIDLKQILICVNGSCKILVDDGYSKKNIKLSNPNQGLLLEGLIWREMYDFSDDCVLLVLADNYYNEDDYIRNYNDFILKAVVD
jgi:dTDP-4-dehydrorhamnose 3,5-epimerase-like enzyme